MEDEYNYGGQVAWSLNSAGSHHACIMQNPSFQTLELGWEAHERGVHVRAMPMNGVSLHGETPAGIDWL